MALKRYSTGNTDVLFKIIQGKPHPTFRGVHSRNVPVDLGMAFRTSDTPIGYLPFFSAKDFNLSGETSFKEEVLARMPIDLSSAASPHTILIQETLADVEFTGSGSEVLADIQQLVKKDVLRRAMAAASGVLVDGIMLALGGPAIRTAVDQLVASKVKQFILSRSISAATKKYLKEHGGVDAGALLNDVP
jgi:hypothetical protein